MRTGGQGGVSTDLLNYNRCCISVCYAKQKNRRLDVHCHRGQGIGRRKVAGHYTAAELSDRRTVEHLKRTAERAGPRCVRGRVSKITNHDPRETYAILIPAVQLIVVGPRLPVLQSR